MSLRFRSKTMLEKSKKVLRTKNGILLIALCLLGIAVPVMAFSYGPMVSVQPESGTLSGGTSSVSDAQASGGSSVKFATPSTTCPAYPSYPDATCTGVPNGTTLTTYTGPSTLAAGTVIDGKIITTCLYTDQPGVIIRNSRITAQCAYVVDSWNTSSQQSNWTQIIDSEIICTNAGTGVGERGVIVRGVEISGCENGMDLDQDALIENSYIHTLDEGPTGEGHGDGIQSALLINITIRHNTIIGRSGDLTTPGNNATSAIITPPNGTRDTLIENNFLAGGAATIYCPENSPVNVRVINNTFAVRPGPLGAAYYYADACNSGTVFTGNVTNTGVPVNP